MSEPPRIVVLRALNLGDLLTAVPALRALGDAYPKHRRVLVTPAVFAPLVLREDLADEVVHSHELAPLDARLAEPDVAVDLHGRGPGSQPLLLALRPCRLIAFSHPAIPETTGFPKWRRGEHEVVRWCRLLEECGIPADPRRLDLRWPVRQRKPCEFTKAVAGATIIHPGAASAARRWPIERFAAVARSELTSGRRVVITGGPAEQRLATHLAALAGTGVGSVLAGRTDLDALAAVVAAGGRLVSGDTGVSHLATALGTPSVTLFGPVPPSEWGPPPDRVCHIALWSGRRGDPHATVVDAGLLEIGVGDVTEALGRLCQVTGFSESSGCAASTLASSADPGPNPTPTR